MILTNSKRMTPRGKWYSFGRDYYLDVIWPARVQHRLDELIKLAKRLTDGVEIDMDARLDDNNE